MALDWSELPENYWHCYVRLKESKTNAVPLGVLNDLNIEQIVAQVVEPWREARPFNVGGIVVNSADEVAEIKVVRTPQSLEGCIRDFEYRMSEKGRPGNVTDERLIPFWDSDEYTNEFLYSEDGPGAPVPAADVALVRKICERLPYAARILGSRSRKDKQPYTIEDEYDVQDLLHAVIRAYVKYSVQEDPIGKVAATRYSRADISIEDLGVLVEVKYVRGPEDQKRVVDEHSQDLVLYAKWEPLRRLILLVYNSSVLRDAEALEQLAGRHEVTGRTFEVDVVLA